jgi:hypothetical protein
VSYNAIYMAKRGRPVSIDGLIAELMSLDARRQQLVQQIQSAVSGLLPGGGEMPGPFARKRAGIAKAPKAPKAARKRNRKPMSAAARKAVGERMKKYWAARRKAKAA